MPTLFSTLKPILLASASPRRQDFLNKLGLKYTVYPALAPEPEIANLEKPCDFTMRAASQKAREVFLKYHTPSHLAANPCAVVIGADTIVALGDEIMGKPQNPKEALSMLVRLAGQTQTVYTGCCVLVPNKDKSTRPKSFKEICFFVKSDVRMHNFSKELLFAYVQTGEPMDKAGAYAVQGIGSFLVEEIQGSWSNVVGLPLGPLVKLLLEHEIIKIKTASNE